MGAELLQKYVDLNRTFVPVASDTQLSAEAYSRLANLYHSATWPDLLQLKRVVVLAEAGSGKTEEFRERAKALEEGAEKKDAFFAAIEQVAEIGLVATLGQKRAANFNEWLRSSRPGWLFLDSVDEAKLQRHSYSKAMTNIAAVLGEAARRAHIFISCRATDWEPERDLQMFNDHLPPMAEMDEPSEPDPEEVLLAPLERGNQKKKPEPEAAPTIQIYGLANLSASQQRAFLNDRKVEDIDSFERAVRLRGLEPLAERPGDLAMLVHSWKTSGRFDSLRKMMEEHVSQRLKERSDREDADFLTDAHARDAAERLAVAMTLGKKLTIKAPTDDEPVADALDPTDVLPDLEPRQRAALLRRGIFAPSTYGRVRFHHRSALEYLTASWFRRMQRDGRLTDTTILKVFRRKAFDVVTIPHSLRPAAAWLAPDCPALLALMQRFEPLTLIAFGDPSALPVNVRSELLRRFARQHANGEVTHEFVDRHALWMFAEPRLAGAIREAWTLNSEPDFRLELLRLIEAGGVEGCLDLVRSEALDSNASIYNRIWAARAMAATNDVAGMQALARQMQRNPSAFGPRLAPHLALALFPRALSIRSLIRLMDLTPPARPYQVEGFGYVLTELFAHCRNRLERQGLIGGVAEICRRPPHHDHTRIANRHWILAKRTGELARQAILATDAHGPSLIALLHVAERADLDTFGDEQPPLAALVRQDPNLNRSLFWADVQAAFADDPADRDQPQFWRLNMHTRLRLWRLSEVDIPWLGDQCVSRGDLAERRLALHVLYELLSETPTSAADLDGLAQRIAHDPILTSDLAEYRRPQTEGPIARRWRLQTEESAKKEAARKAAESQVLRNLRDRLQAEPTLLSDRTRLAKWPGPYELWRLTEWLQFSTGLELTKAPTELGALKIAFGDEVADAYSQGMKLMWRLTAPERPRRNSNGAKLVKNTIVLAVAGLNHEVGDARALRGFTAEEAARIADHICKDDQDIPEWLDKFVQAWPEIASRPLLAEIRREWAMPEHSYTPLLNRAENSLTLGPALRPGMLKLVATEPVNLRHVNASRSILRRAALSSEERKLYFTLIQGRLQSRNQNEEWPWRIAYLAILFELDVSGAAPLLRSVLAGEPSTERASRTEQVVGELFGMRGGAVVGLEHADTATLEALLRLCYELVRPEGDVIHDGQFTPQARDEAQMGRNRILTALIAKGGRPAYDALLKMVADDAVGARAHRFQQIAKEVAEREADNWAWSPSDVLAFERRALSPVSTGEELMGLAIDIIDEISFDFQNGDFSSRQVLETAGDEFAVQNWLAEQFRLRSKGLFAVAREKQVLNENKPDIALSVANPVVELAVELKHGEMNWPIRALLDALRGQLAEDYLRVPQRKHGLFVVTNHRNTRFWRDPESSQRMNFDQVMDALREEAARLTRNSVQDIRVEVHGINAAKPPAPRRRAAAPRRGSANPSPRTPRRRRN